MLDEVLHGDAASNHLSRLDAAGCELLNDGFKVLPLVSQHGTVFGFFPDKQVRLEGNGALPDGDVDDEAACGDSAAGSVETEEWLV